jgi:hypothetical protein
METVEHDEPASDWEDARTILRTNYGDAFEAAWFLTRSRLWPLVGNPRFGPFILGFVLFVMIVATVLLSPATDSHFIYTDF